MKCVTICSCQGAVGSLPVRGAWIEISCVIVQPKTTASLPVRGAWIEIWYMDGQTYTAGSLPVRGAWIEILVVLVVVRSHARRSPCGERGLKSANGCLCRSARRSRSPCGERGLKSAVSEFQAAAHKASLPVRGAWIEISPFWYRAISNSRRSPCGERGLKCPHTRWTG